MSALRFPIRIVGTHYRPRDIIQPFFRQHAGTDILVHVVAEPNNPHDRNAKMVLFNDDHIGYVPRHSAVRVAAGQYKAYVDKTVVSLTEYIAASERVLPWVAPPATPFGASATAAVAPAAAATAVGTDNHAVTICLDGSNISYTVPQSLVATGKRITTRFEAKGITVTMDIV
jgi:hypothetical protein